MKKYFKKLFVFIILVIVSLTTVFYVKADSGWDSDYGGGSSWSSSSDWGSSSDSGFSHSSSDYNNRRNSKYNSSGGSNYSYSKTNKVDGFLMFLMIIAPYIILPGIALFITFLIRRIRRNTENNSKQFDNYYDVSNEVFKKYFDSDIAVTKNQIYNKFCDVQNDWMNFNYDGLRKLCTDELFNQYKTLLEALKLKNEQNIMSDFKLNKIKIYNISERNGIISVYVFLEVSFKDFVINCESNKIVRGDDKVIFSNAYLLEFIKGKNSKIISCPSCGALVDVVSSKVCSHCKNTIVNSSDDLILSSKKILLSNKK